MAFTTGTATNHNDLLDKLRLYLVAQGWTQQAWTPGATVADPSTLFIRGPGTGAGRQVFANIRTSANVTNSYYSWEIRAATAYDSGLPWGSQFGQSPSQCYLNLWQNSISYWFFVNDRRFVVVAKCSTNYMSAHCGFFLPWGTPLDYPMPLFVAADYVTPIEQSNANTARRMFVDPGHTGSATFISCAWARTAGGLWYPFGHHRPGSSVNAAEGFEKGARGVIWPYHCGNAHPNSSQTQFAPLCWNTVIGTGNPANGFESLVTTQQNERALFPVTLMPLDQGAIGVLDGVYGVGGQGLAAEQLLTIGARNFRVFQNIARNSADDFFCVEEI